MFCLICRHWLPRIVSPPTSVPGSAPSFPLLYPSFLSPAPSFPRRRESSGLRSTRIHRDTCPWARERQPSLALRPSLGYRVS